MNKITIIGSGSVGSTIAYTLTVNGLCSEIVMIDINSEKPFALVLPVNAGNITFYDVEGNTVEWVNNPL